MNDFHNLEKAWRTQKVPGQGRAVPVRSWVTSPKTRLEGQALWNGISLGVLAMVLFLLQWTGTLLLPTFYSRMGMWALVLTLVMQAGLNLLNWHRLRRIDELLNPAEYLHQWKRYYQGRLKTLRWNGWAYFLAINLCFLLFLPQVLGTYPNRIYQAGFVVLYVLLMAFIGLKLGKRRLEAEKKSLSDVMHRLEKVGGQWQEVE